MTTIESFPDYEIKYILSFLGPNASFARTCKRFNALHKEALGEIGADLARVVDRGLWRPDTPITPLRGPEIQKTALAKVQATWKRFCGEERNQFQGLTPAPVSTSPEFFHELLLIADKNDLVDLLGERLLPEARTEPLSKLQERLRSFVSCDLSCRKISRLPKLIGSLTLLQKLDLFDNQLSSLPDWFGNFVTLTELDLSDNLLSSLPDSFGNLVRLTCLNLNYNELSSLPNSFGNLRALIRLYLRGNQLSSLPPALGQLENLRLLSVRENPLTSTPELCLIIDTLRARGCKVKCDLR